MYNLLSLMLGTGHHRRAADRDRNIERQRPAAWQSHWKMIVYRSDGCCPPQGSL